MESHCKAVPKTSVECAAALLPFSAWAACLLLQGLEGAEMQQCTRVSVRGDLSAQVGGSLQGVALRQGRGRPCAGHAEEGAAAGARPA